MYYRFRSDVRTAISLVSIVIGLAAGGCVSGGAKKTSSSALPRNLDSDCTATAGRIEPSELEQNSPTFLFGPEVDEPLQSWAQEVARMIQAEAGRLTACYQDRLARDPSFQTAVMLRFMIEPVGRVSRAEALTISAEEDSFCLCLARVVCSWSFPPEPSGKKSYQIDQKLSFTPEAPPSRSIEADADSI